jgi:hypothetical protein
MEWTPESVIELIEACKKKQIIRDQNVVSFCEILSPIKWTKYSNSLGDILVKCLYNPLAD